MWFSGFEDAFENTAHIEAIPAKKIVEREPELLNQAKALLPNCPSIKSIC